MVANQTKEKKKIDKSKVEKDSKPKQLDTKEIKQTEDKITFRQLLKSRKRSFPIWLRIIVVILLAAICLIGGAMVGYGIIGNGDSVFDVFDKATWTHIRDIIYKEE